ncbi:hypothetical protein VTK73DRAFT_8397 [Phialemonium thermophilum]|uniref:Leucine-rich repeat-containing protein 40 n=1 Tax=Phialemonium thermophilum TaxID=223376 RepID=A0ABR3W8R7_9PEZI
MEEHLPPNRTSGIPRLSSKQTPSRLPVPRPTSIRPSPSRESLSTIRNPKLRATPSRDQLVSSTVPSARSPEIGQPSLTPAVASKSSSGRPPNLSGQRPTAKAAPARSLGARKPSAQRLASPSFASATSVESSVELRQAAEPLDELANVDLAVRRTKSQILKPRASLAERTIETLAQIPSSPAVKGRPSAFYDPESARKNPRSRPGSSHQSDGSNRAPSRAGSRPGSSAGPNDEAANFRTSTTAFRNPLYTIDGTPSRSRPTTASFKTPSKSVGRRSMPVRQSLPPTFQRSRTPSPEKREPAVRVPLFESKTIGSRSVKPRASVSGLFKKPSVPALDRKIATTTTPRKVSSASQRSSATSTEGTNPSSASAASATTAGTMDSAETPSALSMRKSSAALREQIAKAKAAKRAAASRQASASQLPESDDPGSPLVPIDSSFDFGLGPYGFNQDRDDASKAKLLRGRIESARTSGRLNIAAMELKEIPQEVLNMYNTESTGAYDGSWAESVDLTRFVAADNELEMIDDSVFPDRDPQELAEDEDSQGNIFGGLETLDLHGNVLIALPMGLRRLSLLTSLNLSQNRLSNNSIEVISQLNSLKDLKLGGNLLYGPLDPSFSNLVNLEILDLHGNNISSLPSNFGNLSRLRILILSENNFESLPFDILATLPLIDLQARKNQLSGTLIADTVDCFPTLQSLDVSANQLTHIVPAPGHVLRMPSLHQIYVSMNRLQSLPDVSGWTSLVTLSADENSINAIPDGFTTLGELRSADFSSNDIRTVPAEIGRMENLAMLRLSGNPLRDKQFSSIGTEQIKDILAARLEPVSQPDETPVDETSIGRALDFHLDQQGTTEAERVEENDDSRSDLDDFATPPTSAPHSPARSRSHTLSGQVWPVKAGGVLDRSHTQSSVLHPVVCSKVAADHVVREVQLHHNLFASLPDSLSFFAQTLTSLSLSHNQLVGETYIGGVNGAEELELPVLKELNLANNHITSLMPLVARLCAPQLQKLDVSFNRIGALPPGSQLRSSFPELTVLFISNNHLVDLEPESIRGMRVVDASNNDIAHLNPRLGLLGGSGGLERLDVGGNRFRVPRWNVLERGTEATLRWLRGRVPVAEMATWKGDEDEEVGPDDVD